MTRNFWFVVLTLSTSLVITHGSLWMRGIRPSKRIGLWERLSWETLPKDGQTKEYLKQRFLTGIVVLPITVFGLYALFEWYEH